MLAQAAMPVVIALTEKITLGMRERITAEEDLRAMPMVAFLKVPQ